MGEAVTQVAVGLEGGLDMSCKYHCECGPLMFGNTTFLSPLGLISIAVKQYFSWPREIEARLGACCETKKKLA